tara:strand:+ start:1708 stop:2151 length:444 start_codon:yes stop_codon:yes gene_type:complete
MIIHIVHGVNLDRLGVRQNEFYGNHSLEERIPILKGWLNKNWPNVELRFFQSNLEGEVVNYLNDNDKPKNAFLVNPGAFTHSSVAIADSVAGLKAKVLEVHLSHTYAREAYRRGSLLAAFTCGTISGLGWEGYRLGIDALIGLHDRN